MPPRGSAKSWAVVENFFSAALSMADVAFRALAVSVGPVAIAAARDFGVDLSLLIERLRRTPEERLQDLQAMMLFHEEIRSAGRRNHDRAASNNPCSHYE